MGSSRNRTIALTLALAFLPLGGLGSGGCSTWRGARLYQSGSEALREGNVDGAVRDLEAAARMVPEASEVQNHLGLAYAAAGRPDDAMAAFRRAEALDCSNRAATVNRERLELLAAEARAVSTAPAEAQP